MPLVTMHRSPEMLGMSELNKEPEVIFVYHVCAVYFQGSLGVLSDVLDEAHLLCDYSFI